jgi:hypothetical protein
MGNTERVEVVESCCNLVGQHLGTLFRNLKVSLFKVSEKISTLKILHDNVYVVLVFKNIEQSNNVRVLAHL